MWPRKKSSSTRPGTMESVRTNTTAIAGLIELQIPVMLSSGV